MPEMEEISDLSAYSKSLEKPIPKLTGAIHAEINEPINPEHGMLWYNTELGVVSVYQEYGSGGDWIQVS